MEHALPVVPAHGHMVLRPYKSYAPWSAHGEYSPLSATPLQPLFSTFTVPDSRKINRSHSHFVKNDWRGDRGSAMLPIKTGLNRSNHGIIF
jgi:hypothetical protein